MATIKAVIFDLGGTLLHYHDPHTDDQTRQFRRVTQVGVANIYHHLLQTDPSVQQRDDFISIVDRHIGQAVAESQQHLSGGSVEEPIRAALAEVGAQIDDAGWRDLRRLFYQEIDRIVLPRPGLQETLAGLRERGYELGLISNTFWAADVHDRHLAEHGILKHLPVRVYSCDTPCIKPHPAIFMMGIERLAIGPDEAVYVGDRPDLDVLGAQGAGLRAVLIRSPYVTGPFDGITPDAEINELPELIPVLKHLQVGAHG